MTAPPWGHKPPEVDNPEEFWQLAPDAPSKRMVYWARRMREGSWKPNRFLLRECADCRAGILGIWFWEARYAFGPMADFLREPEAGIGLHINQAAQRAVSRSRVNAEEFQAYWRLLAAASEPGKQVTR